MFKLNSIKVGMEYQYVRNEVMKSKNITMFCLSAFDSDYDIIVDFDTKEKLYILRDYDTGIITDVTCDYNKAVKNIEKVERIIKETLCNNGY